MMTGRKLRKHTKQLFKHIDSLQSIALSPDVSGSEADIEPVMPVAKFLPHITELDVMGFTDRGTYISGMSCFMEGRVSERKTWGDALACLVTEGKAGRFPFARGPRVFRVAVKLKEGRGPAPFSMSASCECLREAPSRGRDGPCQHMIALLVAWVRKPDRFQQDQTLAEAYSAGENGDGYDDDEDDVDEIERKLELFEDELEKTVSSLKNVLSALESTSRVDDMEFLQMFYSKLRLSVNQMTLDQPTEFSKSQSLTKQEPMSGQYSGALNSVAGAIFMAMDDKYSIGALNLLNSSLVSVTGKVLESLVEGVAAGSASGRLRGATQEPEVDMPSSGAIPRLPIAASGDSGSAGLGVTIPPAPHSEAPTMPGGARAQGAVRRSWDSAIEELGS